MIDELELVKRGRPEVGAPSPEARRAAERALAEAVASRPGRPRRRLRPRLGLGLGRVASVAAMLVGVAIVLVFVAGHNRRAGGPGAPAGPQLVFTARPTGAARVVSPGTVARAATLLQQSIAVLPGEPRHVVVTSAGERVVVRLGDATRRSESELLTLTSVVGRLVFYDWEGDVLTPTGQSVAALLRRQDQDALLISQGGGTLAAGFPGAGSLPLYPAVRLASRQPALPAADNGRPGPQYYAFGAPGSRACAVAGRYYRTRVAPGTHCYLAGPAPSVTQTLAGLPPGVAGDGTETLVVPPGTVVLQAVPANFAHQPRVSDPSAQFYVLRDRVALFGSAITKPVPSTDQSGSPDVAFGFTVQGVTAFQRMTARVAHRGELVGGLGLILNQHFAAALGDQLLTVPSIDFRTYPNGVPGRNGADLTGGYTKSSVQVVNQEIQLGALPVTLELAPSSGGG
jgi:SecD/SecF fusion protein